MQTVRNLSKVSDAALSSRQNISVHPFHSTYRIGYFISFIQCCLKGFEHDGRAFSINQDYPFLFALFKL